MLTALGFVGMFCTQRWKRWAMFTLSLRDEGSGDDGRDARPTSIQSPRWGSEVKRGVFHGLAPVVQGPPCVKPRQG